jgi:polysaccharide export outer membrane protein
MARGPDSHVVRHIQTLFRVGTVGGLTDGQLLERFLSARGDSGNAAFGTLVERHGPMVLSMCRRVLKNAHDAEDAFQATFLVFARKAGSVHNRDSLGNWLYGVARRVAVRAKRKNVNHRQICERHASESAADAHAPEDHVSDELALIHE